MNVKDCELVGSQNRLNSSPPTYPLTSTRTFMEHQSDHIVYLLNHPLPKRLLKAKAALLSWDPGTSSLPSGLIGQPVLRMLSCPRLKLSCM